MMDPMTPGVNPPSDPPFVSLKEAARLAGVSLSTAKRRRSDLEAAGAVQDASGRWRIPREAVGVIAEPPSEPRVTPGGLNPSEPPSDEVERLREALVAAEVRAAVAEALAQERADRLDAQDARLGRLIEQAQESADRLAQLEGMRQVTAAATPDPAPETSDATPEPTRDQEPSRKPLWGRLRRSFRK